MERGKSYWWKRAKIYELYIDKFAGDLKTLRDKLPYFTNLGINCLHILPHYPSPMVDDGYDVSDYCGVRPELGTIEDFRAFVADAHERGIRIIVDFVLNHVSSEHPWFKEARASLDNSKRNFFLWSKDGSELKSAVNAFSDFKPSNWIPNPQTGDYYFATFYPQQPDLNWHNPEVMREMLLVIDFWMDVGVDGFRLDAVSHIIKREGTAQLPEIHTIIRQLRLYIEKKRPEVILLAEVHQSMSFLKKYFGEGDECHLVYNFPLMEEAWLFIKRGDANRLQNTVDVAVKIPDNCAWAVFLGSHDAISLETLPDVEQNELVDFLDPQHMCLLKKGRATSRRITSVFNGKKEEIVRAFKLLYSLPGAPIMYYGDEIGMENLPLESGILDTRKYVRGNFDWNRALQEINNPDSIFNAVKSIIKDTT